MFQTWQCAFNKEFQGFQQNLVIGCTILNWLKRSLSTYALQPIKHDIHDNAKQNRRERENFWTWTYE